MPSIFWTTNGIGDGAAAYTQQQIIDWLRYTFLRDPSVQGIVVGVGGEFGVTATGNVLTIQSGAAYVYGFPFWESTAQTLTVPIPTVNTTGHRVVIRADWTTQTVRVALKSSSNGNPSIPSLEQTAGIIWEISIATLTITTTGVIALTDTRSFCQFNTIVHGSRLIAGTVNGDRLTPNTVNGDRLIAGTVNGNRLAAGTVNGDRLVDNSVAPSKLIMGVGSGLNAGQLANTAFQPFRRQGATTSNNSAWTTGGTLNSDITTLRVQMGSVSVASAPFGQTASPATITFPSAFLNTPLVFVTVLHPVENPTVSDNAYVARVVSVSNTGCSIAAHTSRTSSAPLVTVMWVAMGPA